ncbi:MAG: metallophosphoesterase family protein [Fidelibacterota bacterium]
MKSSQFSRRDFLKLTGTSVIGAALSGNVITKIFARPGRIAFEPVRFAVIADIHLDTQSQNEMKMSAASVACLRQTVAALNTEENLRFVIVLGDLLLDGELENARVVRSYLQQLKVPAYVICGNHDFMPPDPKRRRTGFTYLKIDEFVQFFGDYGYGKAGKRYYAKQILPGLHLIGLDACLPNDPVCWGGILPQEQMGWLADQLNKNGDSVNLVFMHHNFIRWSQDEQPGQPMAWFCIDNDEAVRKLLARSSQAAPVVISGHRHIGLRYKEESGVNYFVTPSINSYPMRYSVFTLSRFAISWKTPMVAVPETVHLDARANLLKATWWRGARCRERSPANDAAVRDFYEESDKIFGRKEFS